MQWNNNEGCVEGGGGDNIRILNGLQNGETPLMMAIRYFCGAEVFSLMLDKGADVNASDKVWLGWVKVYLNRVGYRRVLL